MTETSLQNAVIKKYPMMFRNDNGAGWFYHKEGDKPIFLRYGLHPGSGDLVGYVEKVITQDMVGQKIAVFASVELKTINDTIKQNQIDWHNAILLAGGISEIWHEIQNEKIRIINENYSRDV